MTGKWRKSSRSQPNGANCVEARLSDGTPQFRDSKLGDTSPIIAVSRDDYTALLTTFK